MFIVLAVCLVDVLFALLCLIVSALRAFLGFGYLFSYLRICCLTVVCLVDVSVLGFVTFELRCFVCGLCLFGVACFRLELLFYCICWVLFGMFRCSLFCMFVYCRFVVCFFYLFMLTSGFVYDYADV